MSFRKYRQDTLRLLGNFLLKHVVDVLCKSLRIRTVNQKVVEELQNQNKNFVLAFWHSTMLVPWYLHRSSGCSALTSLSKDGDLLAKQLKHWNYKVVRGSSSKGGDVALGILVDFAKNNLSVLVTPDGPRGPLRILKAGAVITAKRANIPLVLLGIGYKKKKKLKSWDSFEVPYFFTKVNAVYSDPVYIDANLSYDETSEVISDCEIKLNELHEQAQIF